MSNIPKYLYHYTSIETLALILRNRTIRFNSLDKMDDLQEQLTADAKNLGKCVYISSWTADDQESIPMWNMYASLKAGVRIKMKTDPFALRECDFAAIAKAFPSTKIEITGTPPATLVPYHEMLIKGFSAVPNTPEKLLCEVEYSNDLSRLYPSVLSRTKEGTTISLAEMGKVKNVHWAFQKEWRYIIQLIKTDYQKSPENMYKDFLATMDCLISGQYQQPFSYYDMPLAEDAFSMMSITLSPQLSAGNRVIVNSLVDKYNPTAEVKESELVGLI